MNDLEIARAIVGEVAKKGGRAFFVGGYARDSILRQMGKNIVSKDIDVEVFGLPIEELTKLLRKYGSVNTVGESFGVIKVNNAIDISIPRRDSKIGVSHKDFAVNLDPNLTLRDAARRRDFTINSLAIDILTEEVIDNYNGIDDLKKGTLRVTDPVLFADDPLRVLRAMQLAARFNLALSESTLKLCKEMDLGSLPAERIGEEWKKLLLKSTKPSIGLEVAMSSGVLSKLHPELAILDTIDQDPRWHPEGTVWEHTKLAVDVASDITRRNGLDNEQALELMLATLCHDIGKSLTTENQDGAITSHGHEHRGKELTVTFLKQLALSSHYLRVVPSLVSEHMFPVLHTRPTDAALKRLAYRLYPATIAQLVRVAEADILGRTSRDKNVEYLFDIAERANALHIAVNRPLPIIQGRDLLPLGISPGITMGRILAELFEKQLSGDFTDLEGGLQLAKQLIEKMDGSDLDP